MGMHWVQVKLLAILPLNTQVTIIIISFFGNIPLLKCYTYYVKLSRTLPGTILIDTLDCGSLQFILSCLILETFIQCDHFCTFGAVNVCLLATYINTISNQCMRIMPCIKCSSVYHRLHAVYYCLHKYSGTSLLRTPLGRPPSRLKTQDFRGCHSLVPSLCLGQQAVS